MNILICIGVLIYVAASVFNRFVKRIPDAVYIPLEIVGIAFIVIGFVRR